MSSLSNILYKSLLAHPDNIAFNIDGRKYTYLQLTERVAFLQSTLFQNKNDRKAIGIIAGLGVNANFLSFLHCPEVVIKQHFPIKIRLDEVFEAKVKRRLALLKLLKHWQLIRRLKIMTLMAS